MGIASAMVYWPTMTEKRVLMLDNPQQVGDVTVALPKGWTVRNDGILLVRTRLVVKEPIDEGRVLAITVEGGGERSLEEILAQELVGFGVLEPRYRDDEFPIGNLDGKMRGGTRPRMLGGGSGGALCAAARLPYRGRIVRIDLSSPDLSRSDISLLKRIASTVRVRPAPATQPTITTAPSP
jgi:hypothetical protein